MSDIIYQVRFWSDHRWAPAHMSDYLDAELSAGRRVRMERHVADCGACAGVLAGLTATIGALQRLPAPGNGVDTAGIAASVRLRLQPRREPSR